MFEHLFAITERQSCEEYTNREESSECLPELLREKPLISSAYYLGSADSYRKKTLSDVKIRFRKNTE